ncbi:hypothetical protein SEA_SCOOBYDOOBYDOO_236 [Mycobacterium phage ScoobyDoobyDoo]|nr:hypothetical protein SEA_SCOOBYDOOBYDOO_236 [Mycobacterium phage ScoobyDoobyDoo]
MAGLRYVGAPVAADPDLVYRDYTRLLKEADLSTEEIDATINAGLGSYATTAYVTGRDSLLVTQSYIDNQDNLRVKLAQKDVPNGVAALDATGKVSPNRINLPNTQKYHRGPYSPTAYMGNITGITGETTLFSVPVADPGYTYRLMVFGEIDTSTSSDLEHAVLSVRVDNATSGQIIATGRGNQDAMQDYLAGDDFNRQNNESNLGDPSGWAEKYWGPGSGRYGIWSNMTNWYDNGNDFRAMMARRIKPTDWHTGTDFQRIYGVIDTNQPGGEDRVNSELNYAYLRFYMRMSDDETQWVAWETTEKDLRLVYVNGGSDLTTGIQLGSKVSMDKLGSNMPVYCYAGDVAGSNERTFYFFRNGALIHQVTDASGVTAMGPNNRGWGIGARAAPRNLGQTSPSGLNSVQIGDSLTAYNPALIIPSGLNNMTPRTGATTLYVRASRSGSSANVNVQGYRPKLYVMAIPA